MSKCIQCGNEFEAKRADAKVCSNACQQKLSRTIISDKIISDKPSEIISDKTDSVPNLSQLTAQELYSAINRYEGATWAKSPEYFELLRRLKTLSIKQLREQKFSIPVWKLHNAPCPVKLTASGGTC